LATKCTAMNLSMDVPTLNECNLIRHNQSFHVRCQPEDKTFAKNLLNLWMRLIGRKSLTSTAFCFLHKRTMQAWLSK
jgi:hypothetical protein